MNTKNVNSESAIDDNRSFMKSFLFWPEINFELFKWILTVIDFFWFWGRMSEMKCVGDNFKMLVTAGYFGH